LAPKSFLLRKIEGYSFIFSKLAWHIHPLNIRISQNQSNTIDNRIMVSILDT